MSIERKGSNIFFLIMTQLHSSKNTKLTAEKINKPRTSQEILSFYDWPVSILNLLHAL